MSNQLKRIKILMAVIAVSLTALVIFSLYFINCLNPRISITETSPLDGASVVSPNTDVVFHFSDIANTNEFTIEVSPYFEYESSFNKENLTLTITPKAPLQEKTDYKIVLKKKGKCTKIKELKDKDYILSFKTSYSISNPNWQRAKESLLKSTAWPVETKNFNIDYWDSKDTFLVFIKTDSCEENKKAVLNWFKEKKINPDKLNIVWTIGKNVTNECF